MPKPLAPCVFVRDTCATDPYTRVDYCRACHLPETHPRHNPDLITTDPRERASTGDRHE